MKEKAVNEGRPGYGFSIKTDGTKVSEDQIKEWLLQLIENEGTT
ncbi:MAG: hypothetical protein ACQEWV_15565 [Bacillota bacterium]